MASADVGLPYQIGLASRSASVSLAELVKVTSALNLQIARDFAPLWGVSANVVAVPNPDVIDPGVWPIFIEDDIGADLSGFHTTAQNQPYARVESGAAWSLTASHECLEMLADPTGNRLYPSVGIGLVNGEFRDLGKAKFEYLIEVCDPCQDDACAYMINEVVVADFYTPRFFDPVSLDTVRYSFSGRIKRPRQVLPGGYLSWRNPNGIGFQQARFFERPEIVNIPMPPRSVGAPDSSGARTSLRGLLGQLTPGVARSRLLPTAPIALAQDARQNWLGVANATKASLYGASPRRGGNCPEPVKSRDEIVALIAENRALLGKPGVMVARPGWLLSAGWLKPQRAIVVIAADDQADAVRASLPAAVAGVPLDVRAANALQTLRHNRPTEYALLASGPRQEYEVPDFAGEIRFGDGLPPDMVALLGASRPNKPKLDYTRPAGVTLNDITEPMTLTLHASPDAGWQLLQEFLATNPGELVVGMYDFTAPHIDRALIAGLGGNGLTMALDHPPGKATREQTVDKTASDLDQLGERLSFAWALERSDPKAAQWIYPNAYHIKVAVRTDDAMWLSSGNWNTTNQPVIDVADRDAAIAIAKNSDRDWHVVAQSPGLARVFKAFLEEDNRVALQHQLAGSVAGAFNPLEVPPELLALEAARAKATETFFPPHKVSGLLRVRPLLTPFDYEGPILELINGAQARFWMQTQYIKFSGRPGDEDHDALIAAVAARAAAGVDVRLITSEFQTADLIEKLMDAGIDQSLLRIQPHVHNKGMIVDSKTVVISSQNWSADGTLRNRDAGIILYDNADAVQYFERIFLHDWAHLATQQVHQ